MFRRWSTIGLNVRDGGTRDMPIDSSQSSYLISIASPVEGLPHLVNFRHYLQCHLVRYNTKWYHMLLYDSIQYCIVP